MTFHPIFDSPFPYTIEFVLIEDLIKFFNEKLDKYNLNYRGFPTNFQIEVPNFINKMKELHKKYEKDIIINDFRELITFMGEFLHFDNNSDEIKLFTETKLYKKVDNIRFILIKHKNELKIPENWLQELYCSPWTAKPRLSP